MRVEFADHAPDFVALRVKEYKGGGEFKTIQRCKFLADTLLNIEADDVYRRANADGVGQFLFELVNDGLNLGAGNSEGGLKFKQDGGSRTDERLHLFCIVHERGLTWM